MNPSEPNKRFYFPLQKMKALWKDIAVHDQKGTVFFVDTSLDVLEVGRAVSQDNIEYVQEQIKQGKIFRLEEEQKSTLAQKVCVFVIVQPYIFVENPS